MQETPRSAHLRIRQSLLPICLAATALLPALARAGSDKEASETTDIPELAVESAKLETEQSFGILPPGTPVYASPNADAPSWPLPKPVAVPLTAESGEGSWQTVRINRAFPDEMEVCAETFSPRFAIEFSFRRDELSWFVARPFVASFDDGTGVALAPGIVAEVPSSFSGESDNVRATFDTTEYRISADVSAKHLARRATPRSFEFPARAEGDPRKVRLEALYLDGTSLADAVDSTSDEQSEDEQGNDSEEEPESLLDSLGPAESEDLADRVTRATNDKPNWPEDRTMSVRQRSPLGDHESAARLRTDCAVIDVAVAEQEAEPRPADAKSAFSPGSSDFRIPVSKGSTLRFPDGTKAGELRSELVLEGKRRVVIRGDREMVCFDPLEGYYPRIVQAEESFAICVDASKAKKPGASPR